jgi:hypothetical protein
LGALARRDQGVIKRPDAVGFLTHEVDYGVALREDTHECTIAGKPFAHPTSGASNDTQVDGDAMTRAPDIVRAESAVLTV